MTPLEAAARAIADAIDGHPEDWRDCLPEARAAIKAIRTPSEAMVEAAISPWDQLPGTDGECLTAIWQAMCDAMLAEPPTDPTASPSPTQRALTEAERQHPNAPIHQP